MPVRPWPTMTIGGTTSTPTISGCAARYATIRMPVAEIPDDLAADERRAQLVQRGFVAQRCDEPVQTVAPRVVAEIVEPGLFRRERDGPIGVEVEPRHRTSASLTTVACGVSISPSGRKNRQNTMPNPLPSVSIQFGTPGSS